MRRIAPFALLLSLSLGCGHRPPPQPPPRPRPEPPASDDVQSAMLALRNARRAGRGLAPLVTDERLVLAARRHAEDMAARGYFSHRGPDGRWHDDRMIAAGYRPGLSGENIARGQVSAVQAVGDWWTSSGHRRNILGDYRHLGAAQASGYWVAVYGKPR